MFIIATAKFTIPNNQCLKNGNVLLFKCNVYFQKLSNNVL